MDDDLNLIKKIELSFGWGNGLKIWYDGVNANPDIIYEGSFFMKWQFENKL